MQAKQLLLKKCFMYFNNNPPLFEDLPRRKTANQLKNFAKEMCIKRYSGFTKDQMIVLIERKGDPFRHTRAVNTKMLR